MIIVSPLIQRRKFIKKIYQHGAVDLEHAVGLKEAGIRETVIFKRLVKRGYVCETENGKIYLGKQGLEKATRWC